MHPVKGHLCAWSWGEPHIFDGSERGFNELRRAAVDPENATRKVGVVTVDEVD